MDIVMRVIRRLNGITAKNKEILAFSNNALVLVLLARDRDSDARRE